ncbi:hypothetical protein [Aestuariirhabdus litorea]|uniref:YtxH domain-containing protein n=1 Tax=Aestuariirhabdus litorea TaxID=2528527 RepID=A0A3P3VUV8_9GAMM|nr:hypothetical protein [Aestuariirhabdus litorea]RRJ85219.1 hypothetical protein D0544_09170 [Aestuariirhabdus litorea]RWW98440.1 hypothetical protein DZC74_09155 [Endozoicomonadaceae bacterium GTF-13]
MKKLLLGVVLGLVAGLWMGANLGKGQDIWDNPFRDNSLKGRLEESGRNISDALKEGADALKDSVK